MKNLPECDLSHNGTDKINGKIVEMMEYLNSELGNRLLERKKEGLCLRVRHATHFDVGSFQPEHSKCHDNVDRWCLEHRDHKPMRGWLLTGSILFDRHSVADLGNGQLLDITPLGDRGDPKDWVRARIAKLQPEVSSLEKKL
jgi:hypothetical protein